MSLGQKNHQKRVSWSSNFTCLPERSLPPMHQTKKFFLQQKRFFATKKRFFGKNVFFSQQKCKKSENFQCRKTLILRTSVSYTVRTVYTVPRRPSSQSPKSPSEWSVTSDLLDSYQDTLVLKGSVVSLL